MAGGRVKKRPAAKPARPTSTSAAAMAAPPASQRSLNRAAASSSSSAFNRFRLYRRRYLPIFLLLLLFLCLLDAFYFVHRWPSGVPSPPDLYTFEVVNEYPHDPRAFTQGLVYGGDDVLYESTGLYGESTVRQVHLHSGKVQSSHKMNNSYFGEGLTLLGESWACLPIK